MKETIVNLLEHEFVDVMQEGQNRIISIMFANMDLMKIKKAYWLSKGEVGGTTPLPQEEQDRTETPKAETTQINTSDSLRELGEERKPYDYQKRVLELLENKPENISQLAKIISQETNETQDKVKLLLKNKIIPALVDKQSISSMPLVTHKFKGKRTPVYYFKNDKQLSNFHVFMSDLVKKELKKLGIQVIREAYVGIQSVDLETKNQNLEIETSLKHDSRDLILRIQQSNKPVLVIVPNLEIKLKYEDKLKELLQKCKIITLVELKENLVRD